MEEIIQYFISILTTDAPLNAIIPAKNIFTGPVDVTTEAQAQLLLPQINIHIASESQRTVPQFARDTVLQLDIWSRNSQIEVEQVYERILVILSYQIANEGSAHIFWQRLGSGTDMYESDRRIFHKAMSFQVWSIK